MLRNRFIACGKKGANGACAAITSLNLLVAKMKKIRNLLFTRENLYALLLCLILIALLILTADQTPQWIYQGF